MKSWMSFWLAIKRSLACEGPNPTSGPTQHRPAAHLHIQTQAQTQTQTEETSARFRD